MPNAGPVHLESHHARGELLPVTRLYRQDKGFNTLLYWVVRAEDLWTSRPQTGGLVVIKLQTVLWQSNFWPPPPESGCQEWHLIHRTPGWCGCWPDPSQASRDSLYKPNAKWALLLLNPSETSGDYERPCASRPEITHRRLVHLPNLINNSSVWSQSGASLLLFLWLLRWREQLGNPGHFQWNFPSSLPWGIAFLIPQFQQVLISPSGWSTMFKAMF